MALFTRKKPEGQGQASESEPELLRRRPQTIGGLLQTTRLQYGKSIEDVGASLRIRAVFLKAIEEDRYGELPGPVYALGFVRAYADFLGLDGEALARRFKAEVAGLETKQDFSFPVALPERSLPGGAILLVALIIAACAYGFWYYRTSGERARPERVAAVPSQLVPTPPPSPPTPSDGATAPPTSSSPTSANAATGDGMSAAQPPAGAPPALPAPPSDGSAASSVAKPTPSAPAAMPASPPVAALPGTAPTSPNSAPPAPPAAAATPAVEVAAPAAPPPVPAAAPAPDTPRVYGVTNGPVRIILRADKGDSWIRVKDDTQVVSMRVLKQGESYRVPDRSGLVLETGNAGALEVTVDGKPAPAVGPLGKKRYVALDPDRLAKGTATLE